MKSYLLLSSISTAQRREIAGANFGDKKFFEMPNTLMIKCCLVFFSISSDLFFRSYLRMKCFHAA